MNKKLLMLAAVCAITSSSAFSATTGVMNFSAKVNNATCTVGNLNSTVNMGTLYTADANKAASFGTIAAMPASFALTCAGYTSADITPTYTAGVNADALKNTGTTSSSVALFLADDTVSPNAGSISVWKSNAKKTVDVSSGTGEYKYWVVAKRNALATVADGTIAGTVNFVLDYK